MKEEFSQQYVCRESFQEINITTGVQTTRDFDPVVCVLAARDMEGEEPFIGDASAGPDLSTDRAEEGKADRALLGDGAGSALAWGVATTFDEKELLWHGRG